MFNNLPLPEFKFKLDVVGEDTGSHYVGDFVYKVPTILEQDDQKLWFRRMTKDRPEALEDQDSTALYSILSSLRTACVSCPDWWKSCDYGVNLYDMNVLAEVFKLKQAQEEEWRNEIKKTASKVTVKSTEVQDADPK